MQKNIKIAMSTHKKITIKSAILGIKINILTTAMLEAALEKVEENTIIEYIDKIKNDINDLNN